MLTLFSFSMTVQSVPTTSRIRFLFKAGRLLLFRRLCRSGFRKLTIVFFNIADFLFFIPQGYCNPFDSCPFLILFFKHFLGIPSRPFVRRPRPASAHLSHLEFTVNILKSYFRLFGDQLNWHSDIHFSQKMIDFDNDGLLTASDLGRLIDFLTCASENSPKLLERDEVVGYVNSFT